MITVFARYPNGSGRVGSPSPAMAEKDAERARRAGAIEVKVLDGVQLPALALMRAAKTLARRWSREGLGRLSGWRLELDPVAGDTVWGFADEILATRIAHRIYERWARFRHHMREIAPGWREVEKHYYVSGGITSEQVALDGRRRFVELQPDAMP